MTGISVVQGKFCKLSSGKSICTIETATQFEPICSMSADFAPIIQRARPEALSLSHAKCWILLAYAAVQITLKSFATITIVKNAYQFFFKISHQSLKHLDISIALLRTRDQWGDFMQTTKMHRLLPFHLQKEFLIATWLLINKFCCMCRDTMNN